MTDTRDTEADGPRIPTQQEDAYSQQQEAERLLGEAAGKGWQLSIRRVKPSWCVGFCDSWPIDEPITLEEIRDEWGGRKFWLRISNNHGQYVSGCSVDIDAEPRRHGKLIRQDPEERAIVNPQPQRDPAIDLMIRMMEKTNDQNSALVRDFLIKSVASAGGGTTPDPLAQISTLAEAIGKLKEVSALFGGGGEPDSGGTMIQAFMSLMEKKGEADKAKQAQAQPQRPPQQQRPAPQRFGPPQLPNVARNPGPVPFAAAASAAASAPHLEPAAEPQTIPPLSAVPDTAPPEVEGGTYEDEDDLPDPHGELAACEPEIAGEAIRDYLDSLPPEEARRALSSALGQEVTLDMVAAFASGSRNAPEANDNGSGSTPGG